MTSATSCSPGGASLACPALRLSASAVRSSTATRWILVERPPRERPRAGWPRPLFFSRPGGMLVGAHHGGVEQRQGRVKGAGLLAGRQDGLGGTFGYARIDPATPPHVNGVPRPIDRRQVAPGTARAGAEEHRLARLAIGHFLRKALLAVRSREHRFNLPPLFLAKPVKPARVGRHHDRVIHAGKIIEG